jgi:hypothetical protein
VPPAMPEPQPDQFKLHVISDPPPHVATDGAWSGNDTEVTNTSRPKPDQADTAVKKRLLGAR